MSAKLSDADRSLIEYIEELILDDTEENEIIERVSEVNQNRCIRIIIKLIAGGRL